MSGGTDQNRQQILGKKLLSILRMANLLAAGSQPFSGCDAL
jgi:hypothetical protein